jgi:hypothetical protein
VDVLRLRVRPASSIHTDSLGAFGAVSSVVSSSIGAAAPPVVRQIKIVVVLVVLGEEEEEARHVPGASGLVARVLRRCSRFLIAALVCESGFFRPDAASLSRRSAFVNRRRAG